MQLAEPPGLHPSRLPRMKKLTLGWLDPQVDVQRPVDLALAPLVVLISTFLLWCIDVVFGLVRSDRRLGHDLLLGLAVVRD